jgi:hypothetical protein
VADRRRADVHALLAERGPDPAHHAGHVGVAEDRQVRLELEVEPLPPCLQQVRAVAMAEDRADDALAAVARHDGHAQQVGEVAGRRARRLGDLDAALLAIAAR